MGLASEFPSDVRIFGEGEFWEALSTSEVIGDALQSNLSPGVWPSEGASEQVAVLVLDAEGTYEQSLFHLREYGGASWIPVTIHGATVFVGPCMTIGTRGCPDCLIERRRIAKSRQLAGQRSFVSSRNVVGRLPRPSLRLLGSVIAAEVLGLSEEVRPLPEIVTVSVVDSSIRRVPFWAIPDCPTCGGWESGVRDEGGQPSYLWSEHKGRSPNALAELDSLEAVYVDFEFGLISEVGTTKLASERPGIVSSIESSFAVMPRHSDCHPDMLLGYGADYCETKSQQVALLETMERYCGYTPPPECDAELGPLGSLSGAVLHPDRLIMHSTEQYQGSEFPFRPFRVEESYEWVQGTNLVTGEETWCLGELVYYGGHRWTGKKRIAYDVSNGCALGGSPAEAALYGLFEVVERDAFLTSWYRGKARRRIRLDSGWNPKIHMMIYEIESWGFRVDVFDITQESGLPAVWVLARPTSKGAGLPASLSTAGCHLDPERAVLGGLSELIRGLPGLSQSWGTQMEKSEELVGNPELVTSMEDHSLLYCHPEAAQRLEFLDTDLESRELTLGELRERLGAPSAQWVDVREVLEWTVGRMVESGAATDVVSVDQTKSELTWANVYAARVFVPGLLPMTFGYGNHRLAGEVVRARLGHNGKKDEYPHPFP